MLMRKSVYTTYEIDDVKKLVKDVLKEQKVVTKDDLKDFVKKDDLKKALAPYATKEDIEKFVTTEELEKILEQYPTKEDLKQALEKTEKSLTNTVTEFKDAILHEIKGMREESTVVTGYKDQLEDHEERIDKLEHVAFPQ